MNIVCEILFVFLLGSPQPSEKAQVVFVGQIRKIDAKTQIITVAERIYRERRRTMASFPPGFDPPIGMRRGAQLENETKVLYSSETAIRGTDKEIDLADLKIGDSVRIKGRASNREIIATEIEKLRRLVPEKKLK